MTLPELHGWLPAAVLARREGVSPSTIRRRAARDLLDVYPNPLGPGSLYRAPTPTGHRDRAAGAEAGITPDEPRGGAIPQVRRGDRVVLAVLPASGAEVARRAGLSRGTAHRALHRLERTGFARPAEQAPPGPRGGRPSTIWRST